MNLKFIELSCDECHDSTVGPLGVHEGAREVRKIAEAQGWSCRRDRDLCPDCILIDAGATT